MHDKLVLEFITNTTRLANKKADLEKVHAKNFRLVRDDINSLVAKYNWLEATAITLNAAYLKKVWQNPLPSYEELFELLEKNPETKDLVQKEFDSSSYLKDVWEIPDSLNLYVNFLILIYRTTMLNHFPHLRENGAQISSVLEELAALLALDNVENIVFTATKVWLKEWEEEGFSEKLIKKLQEKGLLVE